MAKAFNAPSDQTWDQGEIYFHYHCLAQTLGKVQNIKVIDHFAAEKTPLTISWSKFWVIPFPIFFKFSSSNPSATEWPLEYEMPSVKALQCFHFPPTFKFTTKPQLWLRLKFTKSNPSGRLSTGCPQPTPWSASRCPPLSSSSPWTGTSGCSEKNIFFS